MKNKKKLFIALGGILLVAVIVSAIVLKSGILVKAEYSSRYTQTFGEFTAETASKLLKDKKENTCYSPVSLFAALSLTAEVTEGDTRKEILQVLGIDSAEDLKDVYSKMYGDIVIESEDETENENIGENESTPFLKTDNQPAKITLCNSLWIDSRCTDEDSQIVIDKCREKFGCEIFVKTPVSGIDINNWVSEKTNKLINDMVDDEAGYYLTLINTLYYKAKWGCDFLEIKDKEFKLENGEEITVSYFKCEEETLRYSKEKDYTMVEVPMQEGSMIFVLPDKRLDKITSENKINEILSLSTSDKMQKGIVNITVPQFQVSNSFEKEMEEMVKGLGIHTLFEDSQWYISDKLNGMPVNISQKTKIKVNKDGIEAAAATGVFLPLCIEEDKQIDLDITLDRPFMYILIKDGVPLFIGTVYNPAE